MTTRKQVVYPEFQRISEHLCHIREKKFDAVVIGSGYGGAISASRLARMGKSVCVLERGDELLPGQYPATLEQMQDHVQIHTDGHKQSRLGDATALFDFRLHEDISALIGCGLGGTSLINANVALEAHKGHFARNWPREFRENKDELNPYYQRARERLGSQTYPQRGEKENYPELEKFQALDKAAEAFGSHATKAPINVSFEAHTNWAGIKQEACINCGDCCSGCNVGAKNTTLMNYLPDAFRHDALIYNHATVQYIEENKGADADLYPWLIHVQETDSKRSRFTDFKTTIKAKSVVVAAGTLGTAAIMQRSAKKGLSLSKNLGKRFSGNGDVVAFSYNCYWKDNDENRSGLLRANDEERFSAVHAVGLGENRVSENFAPGPCIIGVIDLRDTEKVEEGLVIEEGVIPGAMASTLPMTFMMAAAQQANFTRYGPEQTILRLQDITNLASAVKAADTSMLSWSYKGAIARTQTFLVMSVDESCGELQLSDNDDISLIHWPDAGKSRVIKRDNTLLARASDASFGQFVPYPVWQEAFGNKIITVHPLGGCVLGDSAEEGVVNHRCQVFKADSKNPQAVYEDLFICDGSVIPSALGVNPLLTISALTERACDFIQGVYGLGGFDPYAEPLKAARLGSVIATDGDAGVSEDQTKVDSSILERIGAVATVVFSYWLAYRETQRRRDERKLVEREKETELWANAVSTSSKLFPFYSQELSPGFSFSEIMRGHISPCREDALQKSSGLDTPYRVAERRAASQEEWKLELRLDLAIAKIQNLIDDRENSPMDIKGTVRCPALFSNSDGVLTIKRGHFYLLVRNPDNVNTWNMIYEIETEGFFLYCKKTLARTDNSHWWTDLSAVDVEVYRGNARQGKLVALGRASLSVQDFVHQAATFSTPIKLKGLARFLPSPIRKRLKKKIEGWLGQFFIRALMAELSEVIFNVYGGLLVNLQNQIAEDRKALDKNSTFPRALSAPVAVVHKEIRTADGKTIRLTRYKGDETGKSATGFPIILAPGLGVTAASFATPTVNENLVEYLTWGLSHCDEERPNCDVWLLDYRGSHDSGSSEEPFSIDDIAEFDWQTAIDFVTASSQANKVQIVAHCVGSLSILMALLKGWVNKDKVQSLVCSQLTLHPVTNWLNNVKADSGLADSIEDLPLIKDKKSVLDMNSQDTPFDKMVDLFCYQVSAPPGEKCDSPVCNRVLAIYGPSYLHANLNEQTHICLGDWFKGIHLRPFNQLTNMIAMGYVVDKEGENTYFVEGKTLFRNNVEQQVPTLALPISFLVGALNLEFLPETSQRTFDWLCAHNPAAVEKNYYQREVFSDYGHMDCFVGKNASRDIFPFILRTLQEQSRLPALQGLKSFSHEQLKKAESELENTLG